MATDNEIVKKYSSTHLKQNVLSRYAKKWQLIENYKMNKQERDALLDELYGEKSE